MLKDTHIYAAFVGIVNSSPTRVLLAEDFAGDWDDNATARILKALIKKKVVFCVAEGVYGRMLHDPSFKWYTREFTTLDLARIYALRLGARLVPTDEQYDLWQGRSTKRPYPDAVGVSQPIATVFDRSTDYCDVHFEYVPDGLDRLSSLGIAELNPTPDHFSDVTKSYDRYEHLDLFAGKSGRHKSPVNLTQRIYSEPRPTL